MDCFRVNDYLTLKLEAGRTNIYVNGELFNQCKRLIFNIEKQDIPQYDINSIDEMVEVYGEKVKEVINPQFNNYDNISPEMEFTGHCSNLQAWVENNYNTNILRMNLAFPLLKALSKAGDPIARKVFKEEIAKRFNSDYEPVQEYLIKEGYLKYFNNEELETILQDTKNINKYLRVLKIITNKDQKKQLLNKDLGKLLKTADKQIKKLDLSGYELKTLPDNIGKLTRIEYLNLSNNQLESLPETIGKLNKLEILNLDKNQLETLPNSIGELNRLEILNLGYNKLKILPEIIRRLTSLQRLDLERNKLKTLPDNIGKLTSLRTLSLYDNKLKSLPETIGKLKQLEYLHLNGNQLKTLPNSIGELKQLEYLDLHDNQLESLPETIEKLNRLEELDLLWNKLKTLSKSIKNLRTKGVKVLLFSQTSR